MQRYNPSDLFKFGMDIEPLTRLESGRDYVSQHDNEVFRAWHAVNRFKEHPFLFLSASCRTSVLILSGLCESLIRKHVAVMAEENDAYMQGREPPEKVTELKEAEKLRKEAERFIVLFTGFCEELNLFHIPDPLAYKATSLIESGEELVIGSLRSKLTDDVRDDLRAAAKAMAFELPTASAFHIARALEGTMRQFHIAKIGPLPKNYQQQTFGSLTGQWDGNQKVDAAIVTQLKFIKDHYRNPISHPDKTIDDEQLSELLPVYIGALHQMLRELP